VKLTQTKLDKDGEEPSEYRQPGLEAAIGRRAEEVPFLCLGPGLKLQRWRWRTHILVLVRRLCAVARYQSAYTVRGEDLDALHFYIPCDCMACTLHLLGFSCILQDEDCATIISAEISVGRRLSPISDALSNTDPLSDCLHSIRLHSTPLVNYRVATSVAGWTEVYVYTGVSVLVSISLFLSSAPVSSQQTHPPSRILIPIQFVHLNR
jgi:hypothetical protein